MSEQELNAILEEIKNRGKTSDSSLDEKKDEEINFEFNSFVSRSPEKRKAEPEMKFDFDAFMPTPVDEPKEDDFVPVEDVKDEIKLDTELENEELTKDTDPDDDDKKKSDKKKKGIIIGLAVAVIIAIIACVAVVLSMNNGDEEITTTQEPATEVSTEAPTTEAPVVDTTPKNPLTGESNYNEAAVGKRPVAVVVENEYSTSSVRPQWGLSNADIVLEGESEYSTRLLLFWADYTKVPSQVGPARSARPPFIRFSELFDSVFIHAGLSRTRDDYIGADSVFKSDDVDHINLLSYSTDGVYFGRDRSRTSTIEHTGYLNGNNVPKLLEKNDIKMSFEPAKYTQLGFNEEDTALSDTKANTVEFRWTSPKEGGRCPKTGTFTYDSENKTYTTTDFDSQYGKSDAQWKNLVLLLDKTTYVVKENYKGKYTETYCNYSLSGGKGTIVSNGTAIDITWGVNGSKLWFKDSNGNEVKLNPGKTYIGYGSSNHGGSVTVTE